MYDFKDTQAYIKSLSESVTERSDEVATSFINCIYSELLFQLEANEVNVISNDAQVQESALVHQEVTKVLTVVLTGEDEAKPVSQLRELLEPGADFKNFQNTMKETPLMGSYLEIVDNTRQLIG